MDLDTELILFIKQENFMLEWIFQPKQELIYATGDGKVFKVSKSKRGYGNHVVIDHGYGYKTLYAHMSKTAVKRNQKVSRGDVIGFVGNTGKSVAPTFIMKYIKMVKK